MSNRLIFCSIAFSILASSVARSIAQEPSVVTHQTKTGAEALSERGIGLSETGLIAALHNPDPHIRNLAANELAGEGRTDSIASIENALAIENDPSAQAGIALALWVLHDPKGVEHLNSMCSDSSRKVETTISAARALEIIHETNGTCAVRLVNSLKNLNGKDADQRPAILSALPGMYQALEPSQKMLALDAIHRILLDRNQEPVLHIVAGEVLARIGSPSSVPILRKALSKETNPGVRSNLEDNLAQLAKP